MSHPPDAEPKPARWPLYRLLRIVKLALGIAATAITIARALGML